MNPSSPADRQTIITNDDGASTASTFSQPGHRHGSRARASPRPVSSCLHRYVSLRTGNQNSGLGLARDLRGVLVGAAGDLVAEPDQRVVLTPDDPLLHRDQRVVGDLDVLRADLGAALGDVAQAEPVLLLGHVLAV